MERKDKMRGAIYGQALGDAMGMPSELWSRRKVKERFGKIEDLLEGPKDNQVAVNYHAGQYTDDTGQALVLLDSLAQTEFVPDGHQFALNLLRWAEENDAFNNHILGPTSALTLTLIKEGKSTEEAAKTALSNGAAMRIGPVGCLFEADELERLADYVKDVTKETHYSDITIAGAVLIAAAVCVGAECGDARQAVKRAIELEDYARGLGAETFSASIRRRVELGMEYAEKYADDEERFLDFVYYVIGAGVPTSESISAALLIAYYANDPNRCAMLCASLGGDTDTIGAMATAICGAASGFHKIRPEFVKKLDQANEVNLSGYADLLERGWEKLHTTEA